jgi:flagellar biosynthesis/type III secretory pathway ATPase
MVSGQSTICAVGGSDESIADAAQAILDGHIMYPDHGGLGISRRPIEQSASRVMSNVVSREHFNSSSDRLFARYEGQDLIQVTTQAESDPALDRIRRHDRMANFLQRIWYSQTLSGSVMRNGCKSDGTRPFL